MLKTIMKIISLLLLSLLSLVGMAQAQDYYQTLSLSDGTALTYALLLPSDFDEAKTYPTLLALPPGPQTRDMVEAGLGYWRSGPERGWVVISPVAPGQLFFQGAESTIPKLLDEVAKTVMFEGEKVHVAGVSNGGRSSFRIALDYPERIHSITVLPGFPPSEKDYGRLERIAHLPVVMYAGEHDTSWVEAMLRTEKVLSDLGTTVSATVVPNEGHVIQSLSGNTLFELLETFR